MASFFILFFIFTLISLEVDTAGCANPVTRKEIRDLTQPEFIRYTDAVKYLNRPKTVRNKYSMHEYFSLIHVYYHKKIHGTPLFIPWHRNIIRQYELQLQKFDSRITLPFWDWSLDSDEPHNSIVLSDPYLGSNGKKNIKGNCVTDGPFRYMNLNYPTPHCLTRRYNNGSKIIPFASPEILVPILNSKRFSDFAINIEYRHGDPHNNIGTSKDFGQSWSPNDPIFYLHHSFIDNLYYQWQLKNADPNQYDGVKYRQNNVTRDDPIHGWSFKVSDMFDTLDSRLCYVYPDYPKLIGTPDPNDEEIAINSNSNFNSDTGSFSPGDQFKPTDLFTGNPIINGTLKDATLDQAIQILLSHQPSMQLDISVYNSNKVNLNSTSYSSNDITYKCGGNGSMPSSKKPTQDSTIKKKLEKREPVPEAWINMNNFNSTLVREAERNENLLIDLLNRLPDFKSLTFVNQLSK